MRIDRSFLGWGLFFILVGAVPLAARAGYVSAAQLDDLWRFWPLVVVAAGIGIILQRTPLDWVGGLLSSVLFGLFVGGLVAGGLGGFAGLPGTFCGGEGQTFATRSGDLTRSEAAVRIEVPCGDLRVTTNPGSLWMVEGTDHDGVGPLAEGDPGSLAVEPRASGGPFGWTTGGGSWRVTLPTDPTLDLGVEVDAGSARLDLDGARLGSVEVQVNAGRVTLDLGAAVSVGELAVQGNAGSVTIMLPAATFRGDIEVNAGSVVLCAPADVGLRIETGSGSLASYDFSAGGLVKDGSDWTSPGFDTAANRIELDVQANAGSVRLAPQEGCDG